MERYQYKPRKVHIRKILAIRIRVLQSDLFETVQGEHYDLIVTLPRRHLVTELFENASVYQTYKDSPRNISTVFDVDWVLLKRMLSEVPPYLNAGGVLIIVSDARIAEIFPGRNLQFKMISRARSWGKFGDGSFAAHEISVVHE